MAQIICAVFAFSVSAIMPNMLGIMKYMGSTYVIYLAIHIAISKPNSENTEKSAFFKKIFCSILA